MNQYFSQVLARVGLFFISSALAGYFSPTVAAFGVVVVTLMTAFYWRRIRLKSLLVFVGGLVGIAARYSNGNLPQFYFNLKAFAIMTISLIGIYVLARGATRRHTKNESE